MNRAERIKTAAESFRQARRDFAQGRIEEARNNAVTAQVLGQDTDDVKSFIACCEFLMKENIAQMPQPSQNFIDEIEKTN